MRRRPLLTTLSTISGVVLLLSLKPHHSSPPAVTAHGATPTPSSSSPSGSASHAPVTTGTVTGDTIDTQYGPVQVQAVFKGGRLTAVKVLQVPNESGRDQEIASYAVPRLTQEALGAQSAHIDAVSGASYTSEGYIESLQSALDKAHG